VIEQLAHTLAARHTEHITDTQRKLSAVLIPIYFKDGQYYIIFIQRTQNVSVHKGQISFPGGRYEKTDASLQATALRESEEEIGLRSGDVKIIGELDDFITTGSRYIISPFVGIIPHPYRFNVDGFETNEIIEIPITALLDNTCREDGKTIIDGKSYDSYIYHYGKKAIWGATARILKQFLDTVGTSLREDGNLEPS
jgi:8-oxo-dGTP pyrophosphatase MutT (NUDIX family)